MSTSILPPQASQDLTLFDSQYSFSTDSGHGKTLLWVIIGFSVVGLLISGYLTWTTMTASSVLGCNGEGEGCSHVLTSTWSKWLGVPVSLFGLLTYVGILATAFFSTRDDQGWGPTLLLTLALTAAGSAAWFIGLQFIAIGEICWYCMAVHCCSLLICALTCVYLFVSRSSAPREEQMSAFFGGAVSPEAQYEDNEVSGPVARPLLASGIASAGLVVLMAGQVFLNSFFQSSGLQYEEVAEAAPVEQATAEEQTPAEVTEPDVTETAVVTEPAIGEISDDIFDEATSDDSSEDESFSDDSIFSDEPEPEAKEPEPTPTSRSRGKRSERRLINFASLGDTVDVANAPILGNPNAEHVLVEMIDYTCPHCRNLHPHVEASVEKYGDQVAFVIFHVPLSKKCNPYVKRDHWSHKNACDYARLSLSVWKLDRRKFAEFHGWLMKGKRPPSNIEARRYAMELVGEEVLLSESLKSDAFSSFAGNSDTIMRMNSGLPLVLTPTGKLQGIPTSEEEWFGFLEERVGVRPSSEL